MIRAVLRALAIPYLVVELWLARRKVEATRRAYAASGRVLTIANGPHAGETRPVVAGGRAVLWDSTTDAYYEYRIARDALGRESLVLVGRTG